MCSLINQGLQAGLSWVVLLFSGLGITVHRGQLILDAPVGSGLAPAASFPSGLVGRLEHAFLKHDIRVSARE